MSQRVLILGAGSIGTRHASNLLAQGAEVHLHDADPARVEAVPGVIAAPGPLRSERLRDFDGVVVATPTSLHAEHAALALEAGRKVLVEKPLARSVPEIDRLDGLDRVMVGYNLRFHAPLMKLRELTASGRAGPIRMARFWFGSFLPDWRPTVDYRTTYSAIAEMGGGVLLDAIHELDLIVWWFGPEVQVRGAIVATAGALDIDVADSVQAVLQAPTGATIGVSLDYLSRAYRRGVELIGDDATLRFDWQRRAIEVEDADGTEVLPVDAPVAQSYELQSARFLAWIGGRALPAVDGHTGLASLQLADDIFAAGR